MKVTASIPSVEDVEVNASPNSTVEDLKNLICRKLGIESQFSRLLLNGRSLSPELKLSQLDLSGVKLVVDYVWARHLILWGKEGQRRLREANVLMVGAGAIGNELAKNLAMLGLGRLTVVDFDLIELSNTSRMIFFDRRNVGQSKVKVLAKAVMAKYPHTEVVAYESKLESIPLNAYLEADVIVCGLDNMASRIYLSAVAAKHLVPIVDAGILGYQARIQTYVPPKSPCLACVLPKGQYGQLAGLKNPCDPSIEEAKVASLATTASFVSSVQAQEVLKLIIGYPTFLGKGVWPLETGEPISGVWIVDLRFGKFAIMPLRKNERCVVCGKDGMSRDVVRRVSMSLSEMKDSTTTLKEAIVRLLPGKYEDLQISKIGGEQSTALVEGRKISRSGIRVGDFLQVTFKREPDEYRDMIVKLV